jgi:hypothetical protein
MRFHRKSDGNHRSAAISENSQLGRLSWMKRRPMIRLSMWDSNIVHLNPVDRYIARLMKQFIYAVWVPAVSIKLSVSWWFAEHRPGYLHGMSLLSVFSEILIVLIVSDRCFLDEWIGFPQSHIIAPHLQTWIRQASRIIKWFNETGSIPRSLPTGSPRKVTPRIVDYAELSTLRDARMSSSALSRDVANRFDDQARSCIVNQTIDELCGTFRNRSMC